MVSVKVIRVLLVFFHSRIVFTLVVILSKNSKLLFFQFFTFLFFYESLTLDLNLFILSPSLEWKSILSIFLASALRDTKQRKYTLGLNNSLTRLNLLFWLLYHFFFVSLSLFWIWWSDNSICAKTHPLQQERFLASLLITLLFCCRLKMHPYINLFLYEQMTQYQRLKNWWSSGRSIFMKAG